MLATAAVLENQGGGVEEVERCQPLQENMEDNCSNFLISDGSYGVVICHHISVINSLH